MPVCKYFLQGNCRYGNNCNFDHPRGNQPQTNSYRPQQQQQQYYSQQQQQHYQQNRVNNQQYQQHQNQYANNNSNNNNNQNNNQGGNRFRLVNNNGSNQASSQHHSQPQQQQLVADGQKLTSAEFIDLLRREMAEWANAPSFWKMSCYSYRKGVPSLPTFEDISPEEVRWHFYEAKRNNTLNAIFNQFKLNQNEKADIIKRLVNPNQEMLNVLLSYFNECEKKLATTQTTTTTTTTTPSSNPFGQIVQQSSSTPASSGGMFQQFGAQPVQQAASSFSNPFAQIAQTPAFQQQQQPQQKLPLQQPIFQTPTGIQFQSGGMFTNLPVAQPSIQQAVNPFQQVVSGNFGQQASVSSSGFSSGFPVQQTSSVTVTGNLNDYSRMDDLANDDLEQFKSSEFTMGRIPIRPPPRELC